MMIDRLEGNSELKTSVRLMLGGRRMTHSVLLVGEEGLGTGFAARCVAADYLYPNGGAALYRKSILEEIGTFDENFFAYFEDVDLSWRANNAGYKCVLCPTAKCYHICGASTGAVKYNAFKSQQSGRNSILLPLKNEPLLMLILNFLPLALGYLLKCYKFHKQGFGEAWDKGMHEAFALLKEGRLGKRPFRLKDLPNYILMELWMIWNMVPYLWYRLVVVRFDLK